MKYYVFTFDGYGLSIAEQLQREGKDVTVAVVEDEQDVRCHLESNTPPESRDQKERRLSQFDGLLEKVPAKKALDRIKRAKHLGEIFCFFDLNHLFRFATEAKDAGVVGNFPSEQDYLLEIDREAAKRFVDETYPDICVAPVHRFKRATQAKKLLERSSELWVLKGLAEEARTVVPDVSDPDLSKLQILDALEKNPDQYESAGFLLELLIPNAVELTPQRIYMDGEPIGQIICIENKQLGAGNVGPMTDCAQDLIVPLGFESKLAKIAFPKALDEMAAKHKGIFIWDCALLFDSRSGKPYFSEFCANRFGYNSVFTEMSLSGSASRYFESIAAGKNPYPANTVAASVRIFNLHREGDGAVLSNAKVAFGSGVENNLWLRDVRKSRTGLVTCGYDSTVAVSSAKGSSVAEAADRAYRTVDKFSLEGAYYRPKSDYLSRDYASSLLNRLEYGLRKGLYSIDFGLGGI